MDVARTSMIHAAAPHFLWPFAVQYAMHQIKLQPHVSLPETTPTLRWTGKVGDASLFGVWGSRDFVRDTSADKLSSRDVPCVFLGFPPDAPGWQFYHPTLRRVLSSQDVTFDESVSYYRLFPYRTASLPPPPLFLAPGTPPVDPLPPQGPAPSGVSQVDPAKPVEVAVDSGAARGAEPTGVGTWVQYAMHQIKLQPHVSLPETTPTLRWTGKVGDASLFGVWGSRDFVRDTSADKLSSYAIPSVFLGFPPDAPGWQFYHPTLRRVLSSQDVTFDESVSYYRLFPYRTASLPPPPLFLAPGTPPVDPLPPQGPAPSGVSQVDPAKPVEVAVDSGAARGAEPTGVGTWGAGPEVSVSGSAEPERVEPGGAEPGGAESGSVEPGGFETERTASGGAAGATGAAGAAGAAGAGGAAVAAGGAAGGGAAGGASGGAGGAAGAGVAGGATGGTGAVGGLAGVGAARGAGAAGPGGARTGGTGAAGAGGAAGVGAAGAGGVATGVAGGTGAGGAARVVAGDSGAEGTGTVSAVSGGAARLRPYYVPLLQQVLGLPPSPGPTPPLQSPPPVKSQSLLQPTSPLPGPSPYSGPTRGLTERRQPESRPVLPESRPESPEPRSESPVRNSTVASALVAEIVDFAAVCRLDYATSLVAESASASVCPPSVGGECALSTDVLEDR
ncbi:unnamed protein product [Closterium sp. NIES-54]